MLTLLRRGMLHEITHLKAGGAANGNGAANAEDAEAFEPTGDESYMVDEDGNLVEVEAEPNGHANGRAPLVLEQLLALELDDWNDEQTVRNLLGELWKSKQREDGLPDEMVGILYTTMDLDSILLSLEGEYAEEPLTPTPE
jgi:hypothetical protein